MNLSIVYQLFMAVLFLGTTVSSLIAWATRQAVLVNKLEMQAKLAAMELRIMQKITDVTYQSHGDLTHRIEQIEQNCVACRVSLISRGPKC